MAGHSKWKQVKEKKRAADKKRGLLFSKLLKAIAVAAKKESKPEFNPRLKALIEKARQFNVPQENIERAIKRVKIQAEKLEEILIEAYGPGGVALIIQAITDNKNRTIQEIKTLLKDWGGRLVPPGSASWAFVEESSGWRAKFKQGVGEKDKEKTENLIRTLEEHDDVQKIYTNLS